NVAYWQILLQKSVATDRAGRSKKSSAGTWAVKPPLRRGSGSWRPENEQILQNRQQNCLGKIH
ncbi:MAG: hypothetical protein WBD97_01655, partial [Pseudolabrys sp.]